MSTPEEQIAHKIEVQGSKWQKTPDRHFYMQKAIRKAMKSRHSKTGESKRVTLILHFLLWLIGCGRPQLLVQ